MDSNVLLQWLYENGLVMGGTTGSIYVEWFLSANFFGLVALFVFAIGSGVCYSYWSEERMSPLQYMGLIMATPVTYLGTLLVALYIVFVDSCLAWEFLTYGLNFGNWIWLSVMVCVLSIYALASLGCRSYNSSQVHKRLNDGSDIV